MNERSDNEFNFTFSFSEEKMDLRSIEKMDPQRSIDKMDLRSIDKMDLRSIMDQEKKNLGSMNSKSSNLNLQKSFSDSFSFLKSGFSGLSSSGKKKIGKVSSQSLNIEKNLNSDNYFQIDKYRVNKTPIGFGSFSEVFKGFNIDTKQIVAIKAVKITEKNNLNRITFEINIMKSLNHKNIIKLFDVIYKKEEKKIYIIMEYCSGGTLEKYIDSNSNISEADIHYFFTGIKSGLKYLRSKNVLHRDLKPHNILITEDNVIKISDFGLSILLENDRLTDTICGSPVYMAPEVLMNNIYGVKTDLWSLGIILYQFVYGKHPYQFNNIYELIQQIKKKKIVYPPTYISEQCLDLISKLLIVDTDKRISWGDFFMHKWFKYDFAGTDKIIIQQIHNFKSQPINIPNNSDVDGRHTDTDLGSFLVDNYVSPDSALASLTSKSAPAQPVNKKRSNTPIVRIFDENLKKSLSQNQENLESNNQPESNKQLKKKDDKYGVSPNDKCGVSPNDKSEISEIVSKEKADIYGIIPKNKSEISPKNKSEISPKNKSEISPKNKLEISPKNKSPKNNQNQTSNDEEENEKQLEGSLIDSFYSIIEFIKISCSFFFRDA